MGKYGKPVAPYVAHPGMNPSWGTFAEELLHHTSRYYRYTEVFLRHLGDDSSFSMAGYRSDGLSQGQRDLVNAILMCPPDRAVAADLMSVVDDVIAGVSAPRPALMARYRSQLETITHPIHPSTDSPGAVHWPDSHIPLLDPFLALARRLQMPVAVRGKSVELCLQVLAQHLDSPVPQIRNNLREAIFWLHEAGYRLRNHPGLTHREAGRINNT